MTRFSKSKKYLASFMAFAIFATNFSGTNVSAEQIDASATENVTVVEDTTQEVVSEEVANETATDEVTTNEVVDETVADEVADENTVVEEPVQQPIQTTSVQTPVTTAIPTGATATSYSQAGMYTGKDSDGVSVVYDYVTQDATDAKNITINGDNITVKGSENATLKIAAGSSQNASRYDFLYRSTPFKVSDRILLSTRINIDGKRAAAGGQDSFGIMINNSTEHGAGDAIVFGYDVSSSNYCFAAYVRNTEGAAVAATKSPLVDSTNTPITKWVGYDGVGGVDSSVNVSVDKTGVNYVTTLSGTYDLIMRKVDTDSYKFFVYPVVNGVRDTSKVLSATLNAASGTVGSPVFTETDNLYAGIYGNMKGFDSVTFSDVKAEILPPEFTNMRVYKAPTKTQYTYYEKKYSTTDKSDIKPYITPNLDGLMILVDNTVTGQKNLVVPASACTITGFDTRQEPGDYKMSFTYEGITVTTPYKIVPNGVTAVEVSKKPTKLDYYQYDNFNTNGMELTATVNGRPQIVKIVDANITGFDSNEVGTDKEITIEYLGAKTTLKYNVAEQPSEWTLYDFQETYFGTSTNDVNNNVYVEMPTNGNANGSVVVESINNSGKITGGDDGICFYYTILDATTQNFVLEADIAAAGPFGAYNTATDSYAPSGQEFYGLMARDVIGEHEASDANSSNTFAIGAFAGGSTKPIRSRMWYRYGITDAKTGAGNSGRIDVDVDTNNPTTIDDYRHYTLIKNNSGFFSKVDNSDLIAAYYPDALKQQSPKMYVGLAAARNATGRFKNIKLTVTNIADDEAANVVAPEVISAKTYTLSANTSGSSNYDLMFTLNNPSTIEVRQNGTTILKTKGTPGQRFSVPTELTSSVTKFEIITIPSEGSYVTSYRPKVSTFNVTYRNFDGDTIYISPKGVASNSGSQSSPVDLQTALSHVKRGQTIIALDGTYKFTQGITIPRDSQEVGTYFPLSKYVGGTYFPDRGLVSSKGPDVPASAYKTLKAADGAKPIFDFGGTSEGFTHYGNFWHIQGITVQKCGDNLKAYLVGGNHNIIEDCTFQYNGDSGFQVSRIDNDEVAPSINYWPSYNLILNSTSHDNVDPSMMNADGFGHKLTCGNGNVFRGTIAYNNCDDGYDCFSKALTGPIGAVLIEDAVAYGNGFLERDLLLQTNTDSNGFKLGGENIPTRHVLRNSLSFDNRGAGVTSNSDPTISVANTIAMNNGRSTSANRNQITFYTNSKGITTDFYATGVVSLYTGDFKRTSLGFGSPAADKLTNYNTDNAVDTTRPIYSETNYVFATAPITTKFNTGVNKSGATLAETDFVSLKYPTRVAGGTPNQLFARTGTHTAFTDQSANIVWGDFMQLTPEKKAVIFTDVSNNPNYQAEFIKDSYVWPTNMPDRPTSSGNGGSSSSGGSGSTGGTGTVTTPTTPTTPSNPVDNKGNDLKVTSENKTTTITVPSVDNSTKVTTSVKDLQSYANESSKLVIASDKVVYTAPTDIYNNTQGLSNFLKENNASFDDLSVNFDFTVVEAPAVESDVTLVSDMVNVTLSYELPSGESFTSESFTKPVEIAIPVQNVDESKVYAGIYYDEKGGVTKTSTRPVKVVDGKAVISTFTHSAYALAETNKTFADVQGTWSSDYVTECANRLFVNGVTSNEFRPKEQVTRAQFVTMMVRGLGIDHINLKQAKAPYSDVKVTDWYNDYIAIASNYGLLSAFDEKEFLPNQPITRVEMMQIAHQAGKLSTGNNDLVEAVDVDTYADASTIKADDVDAVKFAVANGIVNGFEDNTLRPNATTTREESTAILIRILELCDLI